MGKWDSESRKRPLSPEQLEVCARLKTIWVSRRKALNLTQEFVAEKIGGITQGAVSHFLTGRNALTFEATLWFADLLRVHPFDIDPHLVDHLPPAVQQAIAQLTPAPGAPELAQREQSYRAPKVKPEPYSLHEPKR